MEFKEGQRVRYIGETDDFHTYGEIYTIGKRDSMGYSLMDSNGNCYSTFEEDLQPIEDDILTQLRDALEEDECLVVYKDGGFTIKGEKDVLRAQSDIRGIYYQSDSFEDFIESRKKPEIPYRDEILKMCKEANACKPEYKKLSQAKTEKDFKDILVNNKALEYYGFEKGWNGKYVCVDLECGFTIGKIYNFKNDYTIDNDGDTRPTGNAGASCMGYDRAFIKVVE